MRVIACAGSDEKCEFVKSLGADRVFNYKTSSVEDELRSFSDGSGINVMYDNVGGPQLDAFMVNAANFARIVACGAISVRHAVLRHVIDLTGLQRRVVSAQERDPDRAAPAGDPWLHPVRAHDSGIADRLRGDYGQVRTSCAT